MWLTDLILKRPLYAPEGEGGGTGDAPAGETLAAGGAGTAAQVTPAESAVPAATPDSGGDAGEKGSDPLPSSVLAGKPAEQPADGTAAKPDAAKEGEPAEADPRDKVPEDGKYEYSLPEGLAVDEGVATEVSAAFKEAGLTQRQVDLVVGKYAGLVKASAEQQAEAINAVVDGWVAQAREDKEIGGEKWDATVAGANRVLGRFGTPELDAALATSGLGNHPEVIRVFARIAAAMGDDRFTPGQPASDTRTPEERLYGATTPSGKR